MASVGCFGKLPAQGDFVRVNAADGVCIAFDQWLAEGIEAMQRANVVLPKEPVNFFFRAPSQKQCLVGVLVPSQDSVGRQYPMVVFTLLDLATVAPRFPAIAVAFSGFLASAATLLGQVMQCTGPRWMEQVRALIAPSPTDLTVADNVCRRTLDETRAAEVHRRLFGEPNVGKQFYAYRTFMSACETVRGKEPAKTNVTLECPIGADVDLFAWLELARRTLRWSAPPTFYWCETLQPRVLLPLGPAPAAVLSYLAQKDRGGSRLWPVLTDRPDAIETARQHMPAAPRRALEDPNASLEVLLASLAG